MIFNSSKQFDLLDKIEEQINLKKEIDIFHDFTRTRELNKKEEKALNYENVNNTT